MTYCSRQDPTAARCGAGRPCKAWRILHAARARNFASEYEPCYHGPTSAGLGRMLAELLDWGLVSEGRIAEECPGYAYALTRDGERTSAEAESLHKKEFDIVSKVVSDCRSACCLDMTVLSAASKVHRLAKTGRMTLPGAVRHVGRLGWILREENAARGAALLQKLGLAARLCGP